MAKATAQQAHAATTYYMGAYETQKGHKPSVNRNKARWGFEAMLMDYTPEQARVLIDHYLEYWERPDLEWFLYNYEKVDVHKVEHDRAEESAKKRRATTQARLQEWRNRWQT